jgi:exonuclease III
MINNLKIISLNCRGLNNSHKRKLLFERFNIYNYDIVLLQETFQREGETIWGRDWKGRSFWCKSRDGFKGTAILFKNKLDFHYHNISRDLNGRYIIIDVVLKMTEFRIFCVYLPNEERERKEFINNLAVFFNINKLFIIGGDFNFVECNDLDKRGGTIYRGEGGKLEFANLKAAADLIDTFRIISPNGFQYSWENKLEGVKVRLDRIYVSKSIAKSVKSCDYIYCFVSDHKFVHCFLENISSSNSIMGKGFWKANVSVFEDTLFREELSKFCVLNKLQGSHYTWWEFMKYSFKNLIITHSSRLSKRFKQKLSILERNLDILSRINLVTKNYKEEMDIMKKEIDMLLSYKLHGARIRSRVKLLDEKERPSSLFIRKEKQNASSKIMKVILDNDGNEVTNLAGISNCCRQFYVELLSKESIDVNVAETFLGGVSRLDKVTASFCDGPVTKEEVMLALKAMKNDKSPGPDGLCVEFYKKFIFLFIDDLVSVYNALAKEGKLTGSQRLSYVTLLCKDVNNPQYLRNWRPISLLNVDYKILSKIMANRLKKVLHCIVNIDQVCSIPGRSIMDVLHLLRDVIDFIEQKNLGGAIISIDQTKAFDRVSHEFMFLALKYYGFGSDFINWVHMLYNDVSSSVIVNGHITSPFSISRSVRQGCGLSPLLYVLMIEPFAQAVRSAESIKGIKLPSAEILKVVQYADDTSIIVTDKKSIKNVFELITEYGKGSGSLVNLTKSKGLWLGSWKGSNSSFGGIEWTSDFLRILGINFGQINDNITWVKVFDKFKNVLNDSLDREVSIFGRAKIVSSLACSKLWFTLCIRLLSNKFQQKINRCMLNFIWKEKRHYITDHTMFRPLKEGGIELVDIECRAITFAIMHIKEFLLDKPGKWRSFFEYWMGFVLRDVKSFSLYFPHSINLPVYYKFLAGIVRKYKQIIPFNDLGMFNSKKVYGIILSDKIKTLEEIRVVREYPHIKFEEGWDILRSIDVEPKVLEVSWRLSHLSLNVKEFLFRIKVTKDDKCVLCGNNTESLIHLFCLCPVVRDLWLFVQILLSKRAQIKIPMNVYMVLFSIYTFDLAKTHKSFITLLLCYGKYVIWRSRCFKCFGNDKVTPESLLSAFKTELKYRVLADSKRWSKSKFNKFWIYNGGFVKTLEDNVTFAFE